MRLGSCGRRWKTDVVGLTSVEAAARLSEIGPNSVPRVATQSVAARIRSQLLDPLVLVLLGAAVITTVTAQIAETAVILLVVLVNTAVGTAQEIRADRAVEALAAISTPVVRVRRDGAEREVSTEAVVPGDVVVLGEGDIVPADCRVLVAMGRRGTEVARQAADVVLADDELGSIVAGLEEGRRVYANIRRFLLYGLSGGVAELVVMVAGPFAGMTLPLLPAGSSGSTCWPTGSSVLPSAQSRPSGMCCGLRPDRRTSECSARNWRDKSFSLQFW